MFSDFIKHYDSIRDILRNVFLYGCFSREALEEKTSLSSRKISYEIRRIQQYLEKDFVKVDKDGRNKLLNLSYDPISNPNNFLVSTYYNKSFTKTALILYFYILLALNFNEKPLCLNELEDFLMTDENFSLLNISSKTIERKLKEMSLELGILDVSKPKRSKCYEISKDILRDLEDSEVEHLLYIIDLYKNIALPTVIGHYFSETLKNYINFERQLKLDYKDVFQYKGLHFHPVIDENLVWEVIKAINSGHTINYDSEIRRRNSRKIEELFPYRIRYDLKYGRLYLISFTSNGKCINTRLDRISNLKSKKSNKSLNFLDELYEKTMNYSWSAVPLNGEREPENINFSVIIKDTKDLYIIDKIKCELKNYEVYKENDLYIFSTKVNDGVEMIPWLREYTGYIKVNSPTYLKRRLDKDLKEVLKNYGVIS